MFLWFAIDLACLLLWRVRILCQSSRFFSYSCIQLFCSDHCRNRTECNLQISSDVKALIRYGFSSIKIDGCGNDSDLPVWNKYLELYTTGSSPILVENCQGANPRFKPNRTLPPAQGCPYHFYRTSQDIRNHYPSIMHNLGTAETTAKQILAIPDAGLMQTCCRWALVMDCLFQKREVISEVGLLCHPLSSYHTMETTTV